MFKKKMKQIGAMAMAASMILASVQLPPLAANAAENTNLALSATAKHPTQKAETKSQRSMTVI